jgi:hypothetical protein
MQGKNHVALALAVPLAGAMLVGIDLLPATAAAWGGLIIGSLTKSGVPLLGPVLAADISFTPMVTGKWLESAFGYGLWCFVAWRLAIEVLPRSVWLVDLLYRFGGG